ncbi:response regulator transcription factor [Methylobacter tundripaludum]|uniref:Regulatory protein LuxR n=1 Tax=Methylobacter tundripaludum (strain ATCC BAA-1195 / DSM 17260 / SV96) TaxID=697282 RepID=G3IRC8_METTV|nr:helix-turn-helix transcriptional regulator [Methylobacter tundripaludum]EGW22139.1 regulatory protein LuxR [Methylobacter tundripaludum SV96]
MTIKAKMVNQGRLTAREADVAMLMAEGHADKVIARLLAVSIRTVNAHVGNIYEKLELHSESIGVSTAVINNRCYAVAVMIAKGMISVSIKSIVMVLIFNATLVDDDSAVRVRNGRGRAHAHVSRLRSRVGDA